MSRIEQNIWNDYLGKKLLLIAMSIALLTHGVIGYFTLPQTYDAYVHMFFADHYSRFWFEPWDYRWYTGFLTVSYPPLLHQMIALISKVFPLKVSFCIAGIFIFEILVVGVYRFSKIFFDKTTAGVAALLVVVLSSIVETLHVYGQLPTLTGLAFLLNALPFLYQFMIKNKPFYLIMAFSFLAVVICSHHVTAIFGMVFFIAPLLFMGIVDGSSALSNTKFSWAFVKMALRAIWAKKWPIIIFATLMISMAISLIFPYWYWSKTDPIAQVSIPHGSRDNFFEQTSSGLIFYVIPLALIFALLPAISYSIFKRTRFIGWLLSFYGCLLLGSGGTTPLPKMMLGEHAFNILTLDRFGFWASIIAIPFMAKFILSFLAGPVRGFWIKRHKTAVHFVLSGLNGLAYILFIIYIFHLASFRPLQPKPVDIQPMLNFLNRDEHMRWRFMTLGFGDQMAWLSSNTMAATVDGNYHSARRLPEMTSRPVERLENAKYLGEEGLATLEDFLTKAEKYNLKYVFSNDRFYDPLLYYTGWSRNILLENGIMVWEKGNISTIKPITPKELHPFLKYAWGIIPISSLILMTLLTTLYMVKYKKQMYFEVEGPLDADYPKSVIYATSFMPVLFFTGFLIYVTYELLLVDQQKDPETTIANFYNELDFQRFENAHGFFEPSLTFTLDQYLLEKSVQDGGLLPSYAKLDSIAVVELRADEDNVSVAVHTQWRTSLGYQKQIDSLDLVRLNKQWYIVPPKFELEIPEEQVHSYTYTLFKKMGKRVISSFPTVKDDRVKKPFAAILQANLVQYGESQHIAGEILNADDVPINVALMATVTFGNGTKENYYPSTLMHYNLSPKASTYFQIGLDSASSLDSLKIVNIDLQAATDISERGYIHGGTVGYEVEEQAPFEMKVIAEVYNELTTEINIPGLLIAEKDSLGRIWKVELAIHQRSIRTGLKREFTVPFQKIQDRAKLLEEDLIKLYVNGQKRNYFSISPDEIAVRHQGISIMSHGFLANEIYLQ
ncbi:hypothetical protein IFO69_09495 [Echinicola sp. CAU 1574]|uniref:Membrane protein 6-pyruvoyl-tetrahydropterin synthase-related domain-containing protein n=1 Tax=Echinicola arenosa TaxID=2774144 RepID=A0ABR9AJM5_9BACT|nr:hypothetical protein [Echinicola arenosa]MBD8488977.1 hypothetical protein [Echinicola arenosa]